MGVRVSPSPAVVAIVLSVKLTDGSFESNLSVPVNSPKEAKDAAVMKWLSIMQFGLSMHGDEVAIDTVISPDPTP